MTLEDGLAYIEQVEAQKSQEQSLADISDNKRALLDWCNSFVKSSAQWRQASFEDKWYKWQRASDSIYEPSLVAKKEDWQSKAYVPMTATHRETIHASLYKTMFAANPLMEVEYGPGGDKEQAEHIRELTIREIEKSGMKVEVDKVLADADTFGSGFTRIRYEDRKDERSVRVPVYEPLNIFDPQSLMRSLSGQRQIIGYEDQIQEVQVYRGVRFEHISIWDVFPDPNALKIKGHTIACRYRVKYDDIVRGVSEGYYLPECLDELRDLDDGDSKPAEKQQVDADREIGDAKMSRPDYAKELECYEIYARIPKKWAFIKGEPIDDPEKLIPARILFHAKSLKAVEVSDEYDGEPPIYKMDYIPVQGQFYGRGIPEMLDHLQLVINETVNQRIDNVALVMNRMFAVVEKAVVDRKDFVSKPGGMIRINNRAIGPSGDVKTALLPLDMPDVTASAYRDCYEMERYGQERTSANRVTFGTAGQVKDANQTLGGMELLKQSANEKFAYIGMLIEYSFVVECYRAFWKLIYKNIRPEDVVSILGPEAAMTFKLMGPEELETTYKFNPQGIYSMESKALRQARLQAIYQQFQPQPWMDHMAFFDDIAKSGDLDPSTLKLSPEEMSMMMQAQGMMQQATAPLPKPPAPKPGPIGGASGKKP